VDSQDVQHYLDHTEGGCSIRQLARGLKCHPSTILRQVRRVENRRDDPLIDRALCELATGHFNDTAQVNDTAQGNTILYGEAAMLEGAALEVLASLCQSGAVLAVAAGMEKAVVVREGERAMSKLAVEQSLAGILALLGWISCTRSGRLRRYHITPAGRTVYSRLMASRENQARAKLEQGFGEAQSSFLPCRRRKTKERRSRYGLGETPLDTLARLLDKSREPFLQRDLVDAGKRLREDFELAQVGDHLAQNQAYFASSNTCGRKPPPCASPASSAAKQRAAAAMAALGSGLNDIALRCCCHLEGLEAAERQLGWSARSGKIVLRIALAQLKSFYDQLDSSSDAANNNQMIG
jgi:DNA-binding MarR family transcriptional regulator